MKKLHILTAVAITGCFIAATIFLIHEFAARQIPSLVQASQRDSGGLVSAVDTITGSLSSPATSAVPLLSQYNHEKKSSFPIPSGWNTSVTFAKQPAVPEGQRPTVSTSPISKPGTLTVRNKTFSFLKGIDESTLSQGIGWMESSAAPGEPGVCVIMGHRDKEFRILRLVEMGDVVTIIDDFGVTHSYTVISGEIVESADALRFIETDETMLALMTCYPFYFKGNAPQRYVVTAVVAADNCATRS